MAEHGFGLGAVIEGQLDADRRGGGEHAVDAPAQGMISVRRSGEMQVLGPDPAFLAVDAQHVHMPEEAVHGRVGGVVVDLVRGADLGDAALVEHRDPVSDLQGFFLVVGDENAGDAHLVVQFPQPAPQFAPHLGIQRAEGFVQQQHLGFDRQGPGQGDALALAA